jgi:glycosyltransferase involved in cell wall biosynthesis
MRIVELIDSASLGGAEENTALMARELARLGHEVLLLSPEGPFCDRFDALNGVTSQRLPLRASLGAARKALRSALTEFAPQLVHSHMLRADTLLAMQGAKTPYLRFCSIHNMFDREVPQRVRRVFYRALAVWSYRRFDAVLPVSQYVRDYARSYLRVKAARMQVIPNGIDAEEFRRRSADGLAVPPSAAKVLLSVGRLDHNKGQELVLQAAAALRRDELEVWLAGVGPREASLRRLAADLGVRCRLLGRRDDVPALMARADLVVQASRWEALPNTVLEALALGRPVVATRTGGIVEVVHPGETGWLAEVEDVTGLCAAMEEVLSNPDEAGRRGEKGRSLVDESFTIQTAVASLLSHPRLRDLV